VFVKGFVEAKAFMSLRDEYLQIVQDMNHAEGDFHRAYAFYPVP
jgi:hypothetical protein